MDKESEYSDQRLENLISMRQAFKSDFQTVSQQWADAGHQSECSAKALDHAIYNNILHDKCLMNIDQGFIALRAIQAYGLKSISVTPGNNAELGDLQFLYRSAADMIVSPSKKKNDEITSASHSLDTSLGYEFGIEDKHINNNNLYVAPKGHKPQLATVKDIKTELNNLVNVLKRLAKK